MMVAEISYYDTLSVLNKRTTGTNNALSDHPPPQKDRSCYVLSAKIKEHN